MSVAEIVVPVVEQPALPSQRNDPATGQPWDRLVAAGHRGQVRAGRRRAGKRERGVESWETTMPATVGRSATGASTSTPTSGRLVATAVSGWMCANDETRS